MPVGGFLKAAEMEKIPAHNLGSRLTKDQEKLRLVVIDPRPTRLMLHPMNLDLMSAEGTGQTSVRPNHW
jgi:hypothetical protein